MLLFFYSINIVSAESSNVCCEKTTSGLYCQNVPQEECAQDSRSVPTSCESTSFCKPGICYDSGQGTCLDNTPQIVCNQNNGVWSLENPGQCNLGCCVLGDQAAFVTLTRCKYLSATLGLKTNYDSKITDELQCVLSVQNQDKGACVYDYEYQRACKFTTRAECDNGVNGTGIEGEFFKGKLCSAPELDTICGKTRETICLPGKEEVYFKDSCGNPANIYDASKINDQEYWTNVKDKSESCSSTSSNADSSTCGNCNYLLGSICRQSSQTDSSSIARYGDNICSNLNCNIDGQVKKHGESWCEYTDKGEEGNSNNAVGSRYYKHICLNGQEIIEECDDYRNQECIEDSIETSAGSFSQAACRVNRWIDCTVQTEKQDCENTDRRDCIWYEDLILGNSTDGACLPKVSPGLKFWEGEEAQSICSQASASCVVKFEKSLFGGEECVSNCECLDDSWLKDRQQICQSVGDCGPKINWLGKLGSKEGFEFDITNQ